jgi:hypothetical protein
MPFNVNPNSNQRQEQENTGTEPVDLGQSRYDFRYLVFPNDLGMDDNGHYMVINMNVPTKTLSPNSPAGQFTNQFSFLSGEASKVDTLRYGQGGNGNLLPVVFGGSADRPWSSLPRRTRRIAQSVALHMPSPLVFNTHNAYEEISMSALAGKLGSIGISALFSATGAATRSVQAAIDRGSNALRVLNAGGQVLSTGSKLLQSPINPAVEILFANTLVRQFTLEVLMAPRNEQESINMKSIIKTLRFHGAPELSEAFNLPVVGPVGAGVFWIPPAEFDITFFNKGVENMNILRINTCVLERIEVDYAPTGVYSTFRNGHPVAARLSMGFRELEPVSKKRILQGF